MTRKASCRAFPAPSAICPSSMPSASGLGAVNWIPRGDQVIRRVPLLVSIAGALYPSLPLETLRVALQGDDRVRALLRRQRHAGVRAAHGCGKRARRRHRAAHRRRRRAVAAPVARGCRPLHLRAHDPRGQLRSQIDRRAPHPHRHQRRGPARSASDAARCGGAGRRDPRPGAGADARGRPPEPAGVRHRRGAVVPRRHRRGRRLDDLSHRGGRGAAHRRRWRSSPSSRPPGSPTPMPGCCSTPSIPRWRSCCSTSPPRSTATSRPRATAIACARPSATTSPRRWWRSSPATTTSCSSAARRARSRCCLRTCAASPRSRKGSAPRS